MKNGENMQCANNIDSSCHEEIIRICDEFPQDEEMMILKAKSLKELQKTYKFLECIENVLKINPYNCDALAEIAAYLKEE